MVYFISMFFLSIALYAQPFSFIAMGDTPYSDVEDKRIKSEIIGAIRDFNPPFLAYYGDIKSGAESCTDELLQERHSMIMGILPNRVFYTPGDNEWTDCDRTFLDQPYSELERLDHLRKLFFPTSMDLPSSWNYSSQPNFPENARWMQDNIQFVTLHMVSTNNGRIDILKDDIEAALSLVDARDHANRVWMSRSFKAANDSNATAIVIITQADVTAGDGAGLCQGTNRMKCDAFKAFREQIRYEAKNFSNKKGEKLPVLLVHGDTYDYCLDKSFGKDTAPNLWRLNSWGDFQDPADATVITIDPQNTSSPFSAKTLLTNVVPKNMCK